jgi:hypothetical protein
MAAGVHRPSFATMLLAAMVVSCTGPAGVEVDTETGPVPLFAEPNGVVEVTYRLACRW